MNLLSFEEALKLSGDERDVLLGNGFSIACRPGIFRYDALLEQADFGSLSPFARKAFDELDTIDFEVVMKTLDAASRLSSLYETTDPKLSARLAADALGLRESLVEAIAGHHPERPGDIKNVEYDAAIEFLASFRNHYSLNYDLLLYWTLMRALEKTDDRFDPNDGFWREEGDDEEYVTWSGGRQGKTTTWYLHGALHIFDAGHELRKYSWKETGVPLIDRTRKALSDGMFPLIVAEGTSVQKMERIQHSSYLHRGWLSLAERKKPLFAHGLSFSANDAHALNCIASNRSRTQLFVSVFGDPESPDNKKLVRRVGDRLAAKKGLAVQYYDAASAKPWGPAVG